MVKAFISFILLGTIVTLAQSDVPVTSFVFEGEVTEVSPEFADKFQLGDVISGTLNINEQGLNHSDDLSVLEYRDVITQPEFIVDRNRIEITSGYGGYTMNIGNHVLRQTLDAQTGKPAELKLYLLMSLPDVVSAKYTYAWLEIELSNPDGELFENAGLPSEAPNFQKGRFALSYTGEGSEAAVIAISGEIDLFGELSGDASPEPTKQELIDIVYKLDEALTERDAYIQELLALLERANERIKSLEGKIAKLEEAMANVDGHEQVEQLGRQNARLRQQLRDASAEQSATAQIINALKQSESDLKQVVARQLSEIESLQVTKTTTEATPVAVEPPPMIARERIVSLGIEISTAPLDEVDVQELAIETSSPSAVQDVAEQSPVVLPASGNSLLSPALQDAVRQQQEDLLELKAGPAAEARIIRRGPRR